MIARRDISCPAAVPPGAGCGSKWTRGTSSSARRVSECRGAGGAGRTLRRRTGSGSGSGWGSASVTGSSRSAIEWSMAATAGAGWLSAGPSSGGGAYSWVAMARSLTSPPGTSLDWVKRAGRCTSGCVPASEATNRSASPTFGAGCTVGASGGRSLHVRDAGGRRAAASGNGGVATADGGDCDGGRGGADPGPAGGAGSPTGLRRKGQGTSLLRQCFASAGSALHGFVDLGDLSDEALAHRVLEIEDVVERPVEVVGDVRDLLEQPSGRVRQDPPGASPARSTENSCPQLGQVTAASV